MKKAIDALRAAKVLNDGVKAEYKEEEGGKISVRVNAEELEAAEKQLSELEHHKAEIISVFSDSGCNLLETFSALFDAFGKAVPLIESMHKDLKDIIDRYGGHMPHMERAMMEVQASNVEEFLAKWGSRPEIEESDD